MSGLNLLQMTVLCFRTAVGSMEYPMTMAIVFVLEDTGGQDASLSYKVGYILSNGRRHTASTTQWLSEQLVGTGFVSLHQLKSRAGF